MTVQSPEKVLYAHNYYQQPGGEDESCAQEIELLRSRGHTVLPYTQHNDKIRDMSHARVAFSSVWNEGTYQETRDLIRRERPDILHCNNTFPLISPAVYYAAAAEGLPVVQNLRNYRMFCVNGLFFRDGKVCEECLGKKLAWPGIKHGCYRDSRSASSTVATLYLLHRALGTWTKMVDVYVTLTQFARSKFVEAGLPAESISCKPNFKGLQPEPGDGKGCFALFVGRLSPEKGLQVLIDAWKELDGLIPLKIVGDGPSAPEVRDAIARNGNIEWLGRKSASEVSELMGSAQMLVFPSLWYETFGRVAMEAFSRGTPVIASDIGAIAELVEPGVNGYLFKPGNAGQLAHRVRQAVADPLWPRLREGAYRTFLTRFTSDQNYALLMDIYRSARERSAGRLAA